LGDFVFFCREAHRLAAGRGRVGQLSYLGIDPRHPRMGAEPLECGTGEVELAARLDIGPRGPQLLVIVVMTQECPMIKVFRLPETQARLVSLAARSAVRGRIVDQGAESGQQRVESDFELVVAADLCEDVGVLRQ